MSRSRCCHGVAVLSLLLVSVAMAGQGNISRAQIGGATHTTPYVTLLLSDDIMPSLELQEHPSSLSIKDYRVIPIVFIPADLVSNPFALQFVDKQMQLTQRWYGEQLRGRTFALEPARIVRGTHPLSHYYGDCYPPRSGCDWGMVLFGKVFEDLNGLGYPWRSDRVRGVFFQHDGVGVPALGGGNAFLVGIDTDNVTVIEDCLGPGCAASVNKGGVAHELGHAFGLGHPVDDPEGSPGKSVMGYGFYGFPKATFVNTGANPERDSLNASPFFGTISHPKCNGQRHGSAQRFLRLT